MKRKKQILKEIKSLVKQYKLLNEATIKLRDVVSTYYDKPPIYKIHNMAVDTIENEMVKYGKEHLEKLIKTAKSKEDVLENIGVETAKYIESKLKGTKLSFNVLFKEHPTTPRDKYGNRIGNYVYTEKYTTGPIKSVRFVGKKAGRVEPKTYKQYGGYNKGLDDWDDDIDWIENEYVSSNFKFEVEFSGKSPFIDDSHKFASGVNPSIIYQKKNRDLPKGWEFTTKMGKDMLRKGELPKSKEYMGTPKAEFNISKDLFK
jgi:hypothetical protein